MLKLIDDNEDADPVLELRAEITGLQKIIKEQQEYRLDCEQAAFERTELVKKLREKNRENGAECERLRNEVREQSASLSKLSKKLGDAHITIEALLLLISEER